MFSQRSQASSGPTAVSEQALPGVCIVTADKDFRDVLTPELSPWFQVVARDYYDDLARWTREAGIAAVVLDIDTDGEDRLGGLPVLDELRRLNENLTLLTISRSRARSVEKQSLAAGADAHFRNPVDVAELRTAMVEMLRYRSDEAERAQMRQRLLESSRFQDFVGASKPMRLVYDAIQQVARSSINVLDPGRERHGQGIGRARHCRAEPAAAKPLYSPELRGAARKPD